ncbi:MAG: hypothetical protein ACXW4L_04520 [Candidatus Limnocylindrales bacterium]
MPISKDRATRRVVRIASALLALLTAVAFASGGCQSEAPSRTLSVTTLNDSGVTGVVSFRGVADRTEVSITVEPGDNPDMPAHIHPGTCDELTPQPKFPLENVRAGVSVTVVPASLTELFAGSLAVNIHKSNDDLKTYTACVDIR